MKVLGEGMGRGGGRRWSNDIIVNVSCDSYRGTQANSAHIHTNTHTHTRTHTYTHTHIHTHIHSHTQTHTHTHIHTHKHIHTPSVSPWRDLFASLGPVSCFCRNSCPERPSRQPTEESASSIKGTNYGKNKGSVKNRDKHRHKKTSKFQMSIGILHWR